jgi:hypothetical protein
MEGVKPSLLNGLIRNPVDAVLADASMITAQGEET